jgi:hypothetical protein
MMPDRLYTHHFNTYCSYPGAYNGQSWMCHTHACVRLWYLFV